MEINKENMINAINTMIKLEDDNKFNPIWRFVKLFTLAFFLLSIVISYVYICINVEPYEKECDRHPGHTVLFNYNE